MAHPELRSIQKQLLEIHDHILNFKPLTARPPVIDSSYDFSNETKDSDNQWLHQESVSGLKKLKDSIKIDLGVLDNFLEDPNCVNFPPLSTNAPYLLAVWNEVVAAPPPIVSIFKTFHLGRVEKLRKKNEQGQAGVKVDVVADNGRRWIRVNTAKNSRILSEFREIDSYFTDSEDDSDDPRFDDVGRPSLAQKEFDNSILRMGRTLLQAAEANPIDGTTTIPRITLRLTRLNPSSNEDGTVPDPRIALTVDMLKDMGVDVELGERPSIDPSHLSCANGCDTPPASFIPTSNINLDLSVLIALISDFTHAPLPRSIEEANRRFVPPPQYREWKQRRQVMIGKSKESDLTTSIRLENLALENAVSDLPGDLITHAKALTNQLLQEMSMGLIPELRDRIASATPTQEGDAAGSNIAFWCTSEARARCLRIVSKIGGVYEKRRARALFCLDPEHLGSEVDIPLDEAQQLYWQDSRFSINFILLLPIHIYPTSSPSALPLSDQSSLTYPIIRRPISAFGASLSHICQSILAHDSIPHPRSTPPTEPGNGQETSEIQRAPVTKANPRLTAHTVQTMQWGAELGWTTLTANRSSVKAILRELKAAKVSGRLAHELSVSCCNRDRQLVQDDDDVDDNVASIWIIDPRSLAEGMSSMGPPTTPPSDNSGAILSIT